jgi:hypothetical protein
MMRFRSTIPAVACAAVLLLPVRSEARDPWLDRVIDFTAGAFAGFGRDQMPRIVFGPPEGLAPLEGSVDVVSLGHGGSIVVSFEDNVVTDGPGDDLVIFENAFFVGSEGGSVFVEFGIVQLSPDGRTWYEFPYDAQTGEGLAGRVPVYANSQNRLDPFVESSGGDRFDLADIGLPYARRIRIIDGGDEIDDIGNVTPPGAKGGFDLDAAGAIHSADTGRIEGTVAEVGVPVARALVKLVPLDGYGRVRKRRTSADGRFRFRSVTPSGPVEVRAKRAGIGRDVKIVDVAGESPAFDVALTLR